MDNFWSSNNLDIYIWDVGHGLSMTTISPYIYSASGVLIQRRRVVQIDAGGNFTNNFFPFTHLVEKSGLKTIDCLIITHPDKDHIDDLVNMESHINRGGLTVETLIRNKTIPIDTISESESKECEAKSVYKRLHTGYNGIADQHQKLLPENFGGIEFQITYLCYEEGMEMNDTSIVTGMKFGSTQLLILGDLESNGAQELITAHKMPEPVYSKYRIMIAPHHGSNTADPVELLIFYKPHIVLASVESGNEFTDEIYSDPNFVIGHPIIKATGEIQDLCRFSGTKGRVIHIGTDGISPPVISRFVYPTR